MRCIFNRGLWSFILLFLVFSIVFTSNGISLGAELNEIARLELDGSVYSAKVSGPMVYIAAGNAGIYEVDKRFPSSLSIRRQYEVAVGSSQEERVIGLDVGNGYIYAVVAVVSTSGSTYGALLDTRLDIIDISTLDRVGSYNFGGSYSGLSENIQVCGVYLYALSYGGLEVFNVEDPGNPVLTDSLQLHPSSYGGYCSLKVIGNTAYVANWARGVFTIDISNPSDLQLLGELDLEGYFPSLTVVARDLDIKGTCMLCTNGEPGISVIDISDTEHMTLVGQIPLTNILEPTGSSARENYSTIVINDDYAFLTSLSGKGKVLDISDLSRIRVVVDYNDDGDPDNYFGKPCVEGLVYLPERGDDNYLIIFDRGSQ